MPLWTVIYVWVYWLWAALLALACWRWGDRPTAFAGPIYLAGVVLGNLTLRHQAFSQFEPGQAIADLMLAIVLSRLAVRWPRWWWIGLAAVQLVSLIGHLSMLTRTGLSRLAYALMTGMSAYPSLILITIGLVAAMRVRSARKRRPA